MKKIKRVKIKDYVLVTKYPDKDPLDPWSIGFISEYGEDNRGYFYRINSLARGWRNVFKITKEEGEEWIRRYEEPTPMIDKLIIRPATGSLPELTATPRVKKTKSRKV